MSLLHVLSYVHGFASVWVGTRADEGIFAAWPGEEWIDYPPVPTSSLDFTPFIARKLLPDVKFGDDTLERKSYDYNGKGVFSGNGRVLFYSATENDWIIGGSLKEPAYYTRADDTVAGDEFWTVSWDFSDTPGTATHDGGSATDGDVVALGWADDWIGRAVRDADASGGATFPAGVYRGGGRKYQVGLPYFSVSNAGEAITARAYDLVEVDFNSGYLQARGGSPDKINFQDGKAVCEWSVGGKSGRSVANATYASALNRNSITFHGESDNGDGTAGDFSLERAGLSIGAPGKTVYMGDMSIWR